MTPTPLEAALFGFVGGIAVELVTLWRSYQRGREHVAQRYKEWVFWLLRLLIAGVSAVVALAFYTPAAHPGLYLYLGASAPALILQLAGHPPSLDTS